MNRSLIVGVGLVATLPLIALLVWHSGMTSGVAYAALLLSVSCLRQDGEQIDLGKALGTHRATKLIFEDSRSHIGQHGDVAYNSTDDGLVAIYADGSELLYSLSSAEVVNELPAPTPQDGGGAETVAFDDVQRYIDSRGLYHEIASVYTIAEVEQIELTLTARLALQRLDMAHPDGSNYAPIWNIAINRPGESKNHDTLIDPSLIPQLIEGLGSLYGEWQRLNATSGS